MKDYLERVLVTKDNINEIIEFISPTDQKKEVEVGNIISSFRFFMKNNAVGQITYWHNEGRAAICFGGDSDWGDIMNDGDKYPLIITDDGVVYDSDGYEMYYDEEKQKYYPKEEVSYKEETLKIAQERAKEIAEKFIEEVKHLLQSGAVDSENHNRGLLFGVAIENIADGFLRGERNTANYKNLKCF